jgi:hypothetical protein
MKISKWKKFIESISGTTDTLPFGPNSPRQELRNTISNKDTTVIEGSDGIFYDLYKFQDLYNQYLSKGGLEKLSDFTKENIDKILYFLD